MKANEEFRIRNCSLFHILSSASCLLYSSAFSQNIAINTTGAANTTLSMLEILQISATGTSKGLYVTNSGGAANNYAAIFDQGYVGIGTTAPATTLHLGLSAATRLRVERGTTSQTQNFNGAIESFVEVGYGHAIVGQAAGTSAWGGIFQNTGGSAPLVQLAGGTAIPYAAIFQNGNVGIGTTNPNAKLNVAGESTFAFPTMGQAAGVIQIVPTAGTNDNTGAITWGYNSAGVGVTASAGIYVQSSGAYGSKMYFGTTNSYATGSQSRMMIDHLGNVGIGTVTPTFKLHVPSGYIGTDYINTTDNAQGSGVTGVMVKAGDNYLRTGTAAAVKTFLNGNSNGWIENQFAGAQAANHWISGSSRAQEVYSAGWFRNDVAGTGLYNQATFTGIYSPGIGAMAIYNNGSLGIGNTAPGALLDLGLAGTTKGVVRLAGNTSGNVTVQPAAAAGTWALTLPPTPGNNLEVLTTDGTGISTWAVPTVSSTCTAYVVVTSITSAAACFGNYASCPAGPGWSIVAGEDNQAGSFIAYEWNGFASVAHQYLYCKRLCSK